MDEVLNKVGSYWVGKRTTKGLNSIGDEFTSIYGSITKGVTHAVQTVRGMMQKPLRDLLEENSLPIGIFPKNAIRYEFDAEAKRLAVFMPATATCDVRYKNAPALHFNNTVTAKLSKNKLEEIVGIKISLFLGRSEVREITADSKTLYFKTGMMTQSYDRRLYDVLRDGE